MTVLRRPDRKQNPWYFQFKPDGELHKRGGFASRREAQEAEAETRQRRKILKTGTALSQIANKRPDYVQAYCTRSHCRDNVTRLKKFADWWELDINQITPDLIRQRMIDLTAQMNRVGANKHLVALKKCLRNGRQRRGAGA